MKKVALTITIFALIIIGSQNNISAQQSNNLSLKSRINIAEQGFKINKKLFQIIGENRCAPNGKIIKKISTQESFEILAVPLIENSQEILYPKDFECNIYSESGFKLTSSKSKFGMRLATNISDNTTKRTHKVEFINPNKTPVKVRFYYIQNEIK